MRRGSILTSKFRGTRTAFQTHNIDRSRLNIKDRVHYYFWTECSKLRMVIHIISQHKYIEKKRNEERAFCYTLNDKNNTNVNRGWFVAPGWSLFRVSLQVCRARCRVLTQAELKLILPSLPIESTCTTYLISWLHLC